MSFTKNKIEPSYIGIIDIGTYKIRVGICRILNRDVELIGYGEKRQDADDIHLQEIKNLTNVCENIKHAIDKAEIDAKRKIENFMINIPTSNLFFEASSFTHLRDNPKVSIDAQESYEILKNIESRIFKNQYKKIKTETGYSKNDLKLVISHLSGIQVDGKHIKNLIWKSPKEVHISSLNIFITKPIYNLKDYIGKFTGKNIQKVIPSEFALIGLLYNHKDVVMVDIGNTHTSIIVKSSNKIIGARKLAIGINDLIKEIRAKNNYTKAEIIKKIDEDIFLEEKKEFLEIFEDILIIALQDIVKYEICPHNFFMIGWGANRFIKTHLQEINFNRHELRIPKQINYVSPRIDFLADKVKENPAWIDEVKSNINIYAMIKATLDFIKKDKNKLERDLKRIVDEIS